MFCDEVFARHAHALEDQRVSAAALSRAHKFVLTSEFLEAADNIGRTNEDCVALKHLFRLPHNPLWFEPRPMMPRQCGILIEHLPPGECADIRQQYFPSLEDPVPNVLLITQITPHTFDHCRWLALPQTLERYDDDNLVMHIACVQQGNIPPTPKMFHLMVRESIRYCCFLAVLNSRNLIECESSDLAKLNRARQRRGKPSLFEHKVVRIKREIRHMMREAKHAENDNIPGVRVHWRRGHFKARKTGVFWWSPHMAGKPELGQIEKKYVA